VSSTVYALAVQGTDLYVGGQFALAYSAGSAQALNYVARWNGTAWSGLGTGLNNIVRALAAAGSRLAAGGFFTAVSDGSKMLSYVGFYTPAAPTLTAVAPNPGGLGQAITLTGTNLGSPTALTINGANALTNIVSNSGSSLVVRVPLGAAATGTVSLSTAGGTATLPFAIMAAPGNALAFDGVDDYVAFGSTPAVHNLGPGSFTLEAWVYYDGGTGAESIIRKDGDYNMYLNGNTLHAEVWPGGPGSPAWQRIDGTATALPANRWAHVAAVWNGSTMQLYVNGQPEASTTTSGSITAAANLTLGKSLIYGNLLAGRLDEVRIYTAALTQAQVQADLTSTTASVPASLGLYLNFDQGTPATASTGANAGLTTLYDLVSAQPGTLTNFDLSSGNTTSNYVASYALVVPTATAATSVASGSFTATWAAPANGTATGYVLDVSTAADFSAPVAGSPFTAPASATSYGVTGLAPSTAYYYRVRALNSSLAQPDQGAASNTVSVATPLPVVLVQFAATAEGSAAVRLTWATASEKNSRHFEVERSADGVAFVAIGTVAAAGTTATARTYALRDAALPAGASVLYYRLRQVDLDGTAHYSPVRSVAVASGLSLYPNPALGGGATLSGVAPGAAVQVLDALGRVAATATADATGTAALAAGLAPGVYVVRAGSAALRLVVE
jgi:hypothetical protein